MAKDQGVKFDNIQRENTIWKKKQKGSKSITIPIANSQVKEDKLINLNKNDLSDRQEEIKKYIQRKNIRKKSTVELK